MKKSFIVEIEYEELKENFNKNADVFYDTALECAVENLMHEYKKRKLIKGEYIVKVKQISLEHLLVR